MRILLVLTIAVIFSGVACSSAGQSKALTPTTLPSPTPSPLQAPRVGKTAPDFTLDTLDGSRKVHLSDFRGRAVLLLFWESTCSACVKELSVVQKFSVQQKVASKQIVVLAVDIDKVSDFVNVTALQARLGLTYPILVDDHFQARSSYQVANVPVTYFIDSQHVIRAIVQEPLDDTSLHKAVDSVERG